MFKCSVRFFDSVANIKFGCHSGARASALATLLVAGSFSSAQLYAEESEGEWEFMIAPLFLWGMSIDGESAIDGNALPLDLDFRDDVMENLDAVFTFHFAARKDDLLLFAEYQYVSLDPTVEANVGPLSVNADVDLTINAAEVGAGYTISETDATRWEVLGGLRWLDQDLDVQANLGIDDPTGQIPIKGGDDWYQGFVGARVTDTLSKNWSLIARGDYGYGDSDNDAWHFNAMADYRFNDWGSAFVGYRYMKIDYASSSYSYDAEQQGPLLGISIYW